MNYKNINKIQTKKVQLTKNGLDLIRHRLDYISAKKYTLVKQIKELAENKKDDYSLTEQILDLETIELESQQLDMVLQNAETIIKPTNPETVALGCTVGLKNNNKLNLYTIVCSLEVDLGNHKISENCKLGAAVLEKKVGDVFSIITPKGTAVSYEVVSIT